MYVDKGWDLHVRHHGLVVPWHDYFAKRLRIVKTCVAGDTISALIGDLK